MSSHFAPKRTPYCLRLLRLGAILAFSCFGQAPRFEAGVANVRIDALVTQKGRIVTGLEQGDFQVRDDGELRDTVGFASEALPLDVVLLCQFVHVPPNEKNYQNFFQYFSQWNMNSASKALEGLRPEDRVAVISYGLDPQVEQPLTSDHAEIAAALRRIGTRNGPTVSGAHYMAIEWGLRLLAQERANEQKKGEGSLTSGTGPERPSRTPETHGNSAAAGSVVPLKVLRRSMIITVSWRGYNSPAMFNDEPAIFRLWEENTVLSAIISAPAPPARVIRQPLEPDTFRYRLDNLGHVAAETGGSVVYAPTDDFPDLLARVRSGYSLWFRAAEAKPGTVRRISVELTEEAKKRHPGAEIRARKGYLVR